ncbi:MAG: hypothetical protein KDA51_18245 [Planctomycetales bacterium]|nr:hypothetical protein [Planctomycetales bacterium]MCA9183410.1 hypothetical protein [Planctomycetales bacterium]
MSLVSSNEYKQYRAPRADGSYLVQPSREELLAGLSGAGYGNVNVGSNGFSNGGHAVEFCGKPLDVVREQARAEVLRKALDYTRAYRDVRDIPELDSASALPPLIFSGHQPELFHSGVWFKNFLLSDLAAQSAAIGINFLVDNDLCRTPSIRVPSSSTALNGIPQSDADRSSHTHPSIQSDVIAKSVLYDLPSDAVPWEVRPLGSLDVWREFPRAIQQALLPGLGEPLLLAAWPDAIDAVMRTDRPGLALAEMRHKLEQRIGLETLEVPLSQLVSTRAFARFSIQLLSELPRFQDTYNGQLDHYRAAHHIRSHAHPVPALAQEHGWLEAPWWVYSQASPHRQPLWVRVLDDQLILSDRAGWQATIEGRLDCDNASTQWLELLADGICLRPRALLTTMYLRLIVSDLFLHGIGGGKYDQLTDAIVREFFGIEPTRMAVASATLHLPLGSSFPPETGHEIADLENLRSDERQRLWQLKYHAEQLLPSDAKTQANELNVAAGSAPSSEQQQLTARKHELLANIPPRGEKWRWHREMTSINRRLSELTSGLAEQSRERLQKIATQERQQRILQSREISFCLFPLDAIAPRLRAMAEGVV